MNRMVPTDRTLGLTKAADILGCDLSYTVPRPKKTRIDSVGEPWLNGRTRTAWGLDRIVEPADSRPGDAGRDENGGTPVDAGAVGPVD